VSQFAGALTQLFYTFHASDARGQIRTKKTCISRFIGQPPNRCEVLIDGVSRKGAGFQVYAVTDHDNAIESDSWRGWQKIFIKSASELMQESSSFHLLSTVGNDRAA
jgi:hypothetical protein